MFDKISGKIKKCRAGVYLLLLAVVAAAIGFASFLTAYDIFGYKTERWGISMTAMGLWLSAFMVFNAFYGGNKPKWTWALYVFVTFFFTLSMIRFLTPCLSPIGIYFTVNNMGDVKANALGVPKAIIGAVFYLVAIISVIASSFFKTVKD